MLAFCAQGGVESPLRRPVRALHKYFDQGEEGPGERVGAGEAGERRVGVHALLCVKGTREEGGVSCLKRALPDLACSSNARDVAVEGTRGPASMSAACRVDSM